MCSVIGSDEEGRELMSLLNNEKIDTSGIYTDNLRPTTMKTRVISSNHHLLRIDHETTEYISSETENFLIDFVNKSIHTIDAIILEDYNKGLLTERLISEVISIANHNNISTIVDPKKKISLLIKIVLFLNPTEKK